MDEEEHVHEIKSRVCGRRRGVGRYMGQCNRVRERVR